VSRVVQDPQARYEEIASDLASRHDDVALGSMMGMPCVKRAGKLKAGYWPASGSMTFKLVDPAEREAALALTGAGIFDPSGRRPMRQWITVPAAHADERPRLAELALAYRDERQGSVGTSSYAPRWLNHPPRSWSRKTTAFCPPSSTTSK
jgi:hypothetical protein